MINKIGVLGDRDVILAFKAIGFEAFDCDTPEKAAEIIKQCGTEGFAVLYITEQLAMGIPEVLKKAKLKEYPIITVIPAGDKNYGMGMAGIKKDVEKAIGADILFNGNK